MISDGTEIGIYFEIVELRLFIAILGTRAGHEGAIFMNMPYLEPSADSLMSK